MNIQLTQSTDIFHKYNVPTCNLTSITDGFKFPRRLCFGTTYYKHSNNKLIAFRILAYAVHSNLLRDKIGLSFLVQLPNSEPQWIEDFITEKTTIFDSKESFLAHQVYGNADTKLGWESGRSVFPELAREIEQAISEVENYCFPSMKLNLNDVIDNIASIMVCFKANNITKLSEANKLVNYLQKQSEKYRNLNSERMTRIIEKAKEEKAKEEKAKEEQAKAVDTAPNIITKYGREWEISTKKYDVGNDLDWWFVAEFAEGVLHMNNVIGVMLFIERNGTELETSI